jgi:hypothetical protein
MNPTHDENNHYWFPAKRHGWGWGLPSNRKGWAVLIVFYGLVAAGAALFLPQRQTVGFVVYCAVLSLLLVLVCYLTGEPPRRR